MTLLEKIESGEFSRSRYLDLIDKEKRSLEKRIAWAEERYRDHPSILDEILTRENSRYKSKERDYSEKALIQERKTLHRFRAALLEEFGLDLWDRVFLDYSPETELEVYYLYKDLSGYHVTISEITHKLKGINNKTQSR